MIKSQFRNLKQLWEVEKTQILGFFLFFFVRYVHHFPPLREGETMKAPEQDIKLLEQKTTESDNLGLDKVKRGLVLFWSCSVSLSERDAASVYFFIFGEKTVTRPKLMTAFHLPDGRVLK